MKFNMVKKIIGTENVPNLVFMVMYGDSPAAMPVCREFYLSGKLAGSKIV